MADSKYRLTSPAPPCFFFDDEWVVFNPVSWQVHILNGAASEVFAYLAEAPRSLRQVESLLLELLVTSERHDAGAHAHRVIRELVSIGLVAEDGAGG